MMAIETYPISSFSHVFFSGYPVLPLLLIPCQQPVLCHRARADDQQEGGRDDRPAEEGAGGEGEVHTEVRSCEKREGLLY